MMEMPTPCPTCDRTVELNDMNTCDRCDEMYCSDCCKEPWGNCKNCVSNTCAECGGDGVIDGFVECPCCHGKGETES